MPLLHGHGLSPCHGCGEPVLVKVVTIGAIRGMLYETPRKQVSAAVLVRAARRQ
tara:strand:- start:159 stop:320 length:162 start_codon:yes stop_codon:yes gene_type:complete